MTVNSNSAFSGTVSPGSAVTVFLYGQVPFGLIAVRKLGHASSGRNVAVHTGFILHVIILRYPRSPCSPGSAKSRQRPRTGHLLRLSLPSPPRCKWRAIRYLRAVCVIQFIFFVRKASFFTSTVNVNSSPSGAPVPVTTFFDCQALLGLIGVVGKIRRRQNLPSPADVSPVGRNRTYSRPCALENSYVLFTAIFFKYRALVFPSI